MMSTKISSPNTFAEFQGKQTFGNPHIPNNTIAEFQEEQTVDHSYSPNRIKSILDNKIMNYSKLKDIDQLKNIAEFDTEYLDIRDDLNLEFNDLKNTFYNSLGDNYYIKTQKWLGHVEEITDETIFAKLVDLNNQTTHEIAEFDLEDIPYEDRELIKIGAGFYFSVGLSYDKNGQLEKKSLIRFQRTYPWDESSLDIIIDEADKLYEKLKWD